MPSSITLNGATVYRPSVQANINTDALGGRGTSTGNIALIGDFAGFEGLELYSFTSQRSLLGFDPANEDLKLWGKLAFAPSSDDRVPGGASTLYIVSTNTNTQAFVELDDANDASALKISSKVWGPAGNRLTYAVSKSSETHTLAFARDGISETFTIECPEMGTLQYTGGVLDTAVIEYTAAQLRYEWSRSIGPKVGAADTPFVEAADWDHSPCAGTIAITLDAGAGAGHSDDVTVAITGTTLAGAAQTETVTIATGGNVGTSVASFGSITTVTLDSADDAWVGNATLLCSNGKVISTAGRKISGLLSEMGQIEGVTATTVDPRAAGIDAADADLTDGEISIVAAKEVRADTYLIMQGLLPSRLVETTRGANGLPIDLSAAVSGSLAGGTATSPVGTTRWSSALNTIVDQNVQIVVPLTTTAAVHALLAAHCNAAALQGYERNAWVGAAASETIAQVKARAASLNSAYISLVADRIKVNHPNGTTPTLSPEYLALLLAGMQAGSPVATPLTWKRPNIIEAYQTWAPNIDAGEMISGGVCILSRDNLGWRVERSVTTYLTDDNPIRSEMSAWESAQTCVRDLRSALINRIGNPAIAGTAGRIRAAAASRLDEQVGLGWIKAFQNLSVDDLGDTFRVNVDIAPVEPTNFIVLELAVQRIAGV